jgi:hypothetical protein
MANEAAPQFVCAESTRDYVGRTINLPHADKAELQDQERKTPA